MRKLAAGKDGSRGFSSDFRVGRLRLPRPDQRAKSYPRFTFPNNPQSTNWRSLRTRARFLGISWTGSLCLKRGNHFVENVPGKTFIKRSVTLQPSEEQGTTQHIDQQFWIGFGLQFA